jgi:hypothetical protein
MATYDNNKQMEYSKSKIYKIWSPLGDKIYIGSTTKEYLSQRMTAHRSQYKRWKRGVYPLVMSYKLFEEYGLENCQIELIEAQKCGSRDELRKLEGHYIRAMECVNKVIPDRTHAEYIETHKEHITMKNREYISNHKEQYAKHNRRYFLEHKDEINEKRKEEGMCSCGHMMRIVESRKQRHLKSKKHLDGISNFLK